jgi:hypothetical protein
MSKTLPTLASLLVAVRATPGLATWCATQDDAALSEVVRTAKTTKGAVWLATRAAGPGADDADKAEGRADTALRCLQALARGGDPRAAAALAAWAQATPGLTEALDAEMA